MPNVEIFILDPPTLLMVDANSILAHREAVEQARWVHTISSDKLHINKDRES